MNIISLDKMQAEGISFITHNNKLLSTITIQTMYNVETLNLDNELNDLFNKNLLLQKYTNLYNHLFITFLIYPENNKGVDWQERKHYKRKEKHLFLDIKVDEYQEFCNADKETSLQILKRNLLRGVKKFLENQKDFNFIDFYTDLQKIL